MRRPVKKQPEVKPDMLYGSVKVSKLINYCMLSGHKQTAKSVVYAALEEVKNRTDSANPAEILENALKNIGPTVEVRSRRVGGANYQVPREVRPERRLALSLRWMIDAARSKKGAPMAKRLADEIVAANNNEGEAVKKRENVHKMAEANKAFAHFAW
jgi:small subunit ribosomal protein S7